MRDEMEININHTSLRLSLRTAKMRHSNAVLNATEMEIRIKHGDRTTTYILKSKYGTYMSHNVSWMAHIKYCRATWDSNEFYNYPSMLYHQVISQIFSSHAKDIL
jgi:hypothetical protein